MIGFALCVFTACGHSVNKISSADAADAIYFDGDIVTMEGDSAQYVEAVAIKDGKIAFAGTRAEADKLKGDSTVMKDLLGKTLVPGFHWRTGSVRLSRPSTKV